MTNTNKKKNIIIWYAWVKPNLKAKGDASHDDVVVVYTYTQIKKNNPLQNIDQIYFVILIKLQFTL